MYENVPCVRKRICKVSISLNPVKKKLLVPHGISTAPNDASARNVKAFSQPEPVQYSTSRYSFVDVLYQASKYISKDIFISENSDILIKGEYIAVE